MEKTLYIDCMGLNGNTVRLIEKLITELGMESEQLELSYIKCSGKESKIETLKEVVLGMGIDVE